MVSEVQVYNFDHECKKGENNVSVYEILFLMEDSIDWESNLVREQSKGKVVYELLNGWFQEEQF